ncbi:glycosyltransferase [Microbacterium immunditiarum]|uniref:Glycosyltransferase involved in cell wall biosynthesis n=1 Tax=Microbacterium immunditiarum TaxID=337480 RepID=A0A7Y9KIK3_9MICO|nr:glycosyltransferase involved in cell wall biosynthesis [Microbacterium immunditiarum]
MNTVPPPRRVLVLTHTGDVGGAETALLRLIGALDAGRFAVQVTTLEDGDLVQRLNDGGVLVSMLDAGRLVRVTRDRTIASPFAVLRNAGDTLRTARRLRAHVRAEKPDLIVANSLKAAVLLAFTAPGTRTPWVWHLHDRLASDYLPAPVAAAMRMLARVGPRRVVANSRATAQTLGRSGRGRTTVAYPGVDASAFHREVSDGRDGPVGIVGRVSRTKGQAEFLDAAEIVARSLPDVRFRIVGAALFEDRDDEEALRRRTAESELLASRVEWAGWSSDVPGELRRLGLFVHASPTPEPFGQIVVEAMLSGVPVVATDAGGVPEILDPASAGGEPIADGVRRTQSGLLVKPGDAQALARAIRWALEHRAESTDAARHAQADAADRFGIERTAAVVEGVWDEVVERARGRRRR